MMQRGERRTVASLLPTPLLLVMGVEERAAFTKDRRNIIREKPGFKVPEEVAFKSEIEDLRSSIEYCEMDW